MNLLYQKSVFRYNFAFLDPEGVLLLLLVGISSLKIPQAFLKRSRAHRNFAHSFLLTFPTHLPPQILKIISN